MNNDMKNLQNSYLYAKEELLNNLMKLRINLPSPEESFHNYEQALHDFSEIFDDFKKQLTPENASEQSKAELTKLIELSEQLLSQSVEVKKRISEFYATQSESVREQAVNGIDQIWGINEKLNDLDTSLT